MATIVGRAPGRVNLIGDHTDYTGGWCLPMAIDRWTEITAMPNPARPVVRLASDTESAHAVVAIDATELPSGPLWARFVAAVMGEVKPLIGYVGKVRSTIPIGAGLSSSAALEVACALALGADDHDRVALARLCQRAEVAARETPTGIMDQLTSCAGVEGHALLLDCTTLDIAPVPMPPPDEYEIVVISVEPRTLDESAYAIRVAQCAQVEQIIGPLRDASLDALPSLTDPVLRRRARHVVSENARVHAAAAALRSGDVVEFGRLMNESHTSLRDDYESSSTSLDDVQRLVLDMPGVLGARVTGGGWGGSVVVLCRPGALGQLGWTVRAVGGATVTRR
ncbi:MAG: galactokinase [Acidimicrobiia bacterium]